MDVFAAFRRAAVACASFVMLTAAVQARADAFNAAPLQGREVGPKIANQASPAPAGGWQVSDDRMLNASINGQGGWQTITFPTRYDEEIATGISHNGGHSWRLSNWFHTGLVNPILSPQFASVGESGATNSDSGPLGGSAKSNHVVYEFWFRSASASPEPGSAVSTTISDGPGNRMTYFGMFDDAAAPGNGCPGDGACFHVDPVEVTSGNDAAGDGDATFIDHYSPALTRGVWYRAHIDATFVDGPGADVSSNAALCPAGSPAGTCHAGNDQIHYQIFDASGATVFDVTIGSWEAAYYDGRYGNPVGTVVASDYAAFRVSGNPDGGGQSPFDTNSVTNRPHGVYLDDMKATPDTGTGFSTSFEFDRWVNATGGVDTGDCSVQANPCLTIAYAIAQSNPYDRINIAKGTYDLTTNPPLSITKEGLILQGYGAAQPKIERTTGGANQVLLVINGAKNVQVQNLEFDMDQSFIAEGIIANGFVDGLSISGNHFVQSRSNSNQNSDWHKRNAISINDDNGNSQNIGLGTGSNVSVTNNVIDGLANPPDVFLRMGVDMDNGVGTISGNTITTGVHDIRVRFSTVTGASSGTATLIDGNTLNGRGLEIDDPNAGIGSFTISNNHINALAGIDGIANNYPADFSIMRLMGNPQGVAVAVSGNTFAGYQGSYRGVLVENFPNTTFTGNTFSPASGVSDFVSLVVSNKALNTDNPPDAPLQMSITANANTFNGSGVAGAGRAVEFLNDNANVAGPTVATFGALNFGDGTAPNANNFDGNLRWYFHLDDYNCETVNLPTCTFLNYAGDIGSDPGTNTDVRPFNGNVSALGNTFAGVPATTTQSQADVEAHTYDNTANPVLGTVNYGFGAFETVYVNSSFAGNYGDTVTFTSPAVDCGANAPQTAYLGVNAFATINAGAAHVQAGGFVCVAANSYAENVVVAQSAHIIGAGQGATTVMPATFNPDCSVGGGTDSLCSNGSTVASVVFLVQASNVEITGLTVDGINPNLVGHATSIAARDGIMTDFRTSVAYTGFKVHDTTVQNIYLRGIYSPASNGRFEFRNNTVNNVKSDPSSIAIFNSTGGGIIDGNTVSGANDAISANHSYGTTFTNNTITNSGSGIHTDNNNDGAGGSADVIANNTINCGVKDGYGIFTFVPYKDVSIHDNNVSGCAVGLGAFGGLFGSQPIATSTFTHNSVNGTGAAATTPPTIGAYLSTTTFSYGDTDNQVVLTGNTITGFGQGVFTERTGGPQKSLTTTASFNRIVGNAAGWVDGTGPGVSTFVNNWWGCNGGPGAAGCDTASNAPAVNPWLVLQASASPNPTGNGTSTITADLTHNSANAVVGTVFPDGTSVAFNATRGAIAPTANTASGDAATNLTGLTSGWSTVHVKLDNADVKLIVGTTPAAAFATVNDDTSPTNPDPDATCPTPDFNNITDAINTVPAGTKILVCSGNYPENVVVNKNGLTLKGAFAGTAGTDGSRGTASEAVIDPATGIALKVNANNVTFDGFTIQNVTDTAIASGGNYGGISDTVSIINNRVLDVTTGSGLYTNGPRNTPVTNWTVSNNVFDNIHPAGSNPPVGSGINLWAVTGGTITGNTVTNSAFGGIQVNGGNGVSITGNTITSTAHNGINIAQSSGVTVNGNTVTDANTSATSDEAGMTLYGGSTNVTFACNSVAGSGMNGFSTDAAITDPFAGIKVFDNAITVNADVSHNLAQSIAIGSNWYGGGNATVAGSNAFVADGLPANPIGNAACGDNTPTQIVVRSGSGQFALITNSFASPLVGRVEDALGGAVMGESMAFTPPGSGASANLATPMGLSDFNGIFSTTAIANSIAGPYAVMLGDTSTSGIAPISFMLTNQSATASIVLDSASLSATYDGNPHAVTATTTPTGLAYTVTYNGSATAPTNAGTYNVVATINDPSYSGSTSGTLTIAQKPETLTLSNLSQVYDGNPKSVTVTVSPDTTLAYSVTYNGSSTPPTAVGTYTVVAMVTDPNYTGSSTATLTITAASAPDVAVSISNGRSYVQYGKQLVYTIVVTNNGTADASSVTISAPLPLTQTLINATWTCVAFPGATCASHGSGDLNDTATIAKGAVLIYTLAATVNDDQSLTTDQVAMTATATVNGTPADSNPANNTATTPVTQIVIFRDGFEAGGDGAQNAAATTPLSSMSAKSTLSLDPAAAPQGQFVPQTWLRGVDANGRVVFEVDTLHIGTLSLMRLSVSDANGNLVPGTWSTAEQFAFGFAGSGGKYLAMLATSKGSLQMPLPAWVALPVQVYAAH